MSITTVYHPSKSIAFGLIVVLCCVLMACNAGDKTSLGKQFTLPRKALPNDARGDSLIPRQIANFSLRPSQGIIPGNDVSRRFIGIYENFNGKQILLSAVYNDDKAALSSAVSGTNTCDGPDSWSLAYPDGDFPYSFSLCKGIYQFNWINGNWILSAATYIGTSSAELITFVNSYPY